MDDRLTTLLDDLTRVGELSAADKSRLARRAAWLGEAPPPAQQEFLAALLTLTVPLEEPADDLLRAMLAGLAKSRWGAELPADYCQSVSRLYTHLGPPSRARGQLLAALASGGSTDEVTTLVNLLVDDPPTDEADVVLALGPLFQAKSLPLDALFPKLFAALAHQSLAAAVLDLANHVTRHQFAAEHPAKGILDSLLQMLGQLVGSLGVLTESPPIAGQTMADVGRQVAQSVALAVSLCDALALIGDPQAAGKLFQALDLGHRRLRTEAAAALARLGEERGKEELVRLAAEPVARLRVLAYAQELGMMPRIAPEHCTPVARAEAELTVWLSEPTQFGLPPSACELFDQRQQFWPGFHQPVQCYLFRFTYALTIDGQERSYSNIGIAGPLAHAFTADLADLSPDDIYAAYAGWQAQHEEIREYEVSRLSRSERTEVDRLQRRLHDAGYSAIEPQQMGYFFSEKALIAWAQRDEIPGIAIADFQEITFFPILSPRKSLGVREAYSVYKGRKLLRTFNRAETTV